MSAERKTVMPMPNHPDTRRGRPRTTPARLLGALGAVVALASAVGAVGTFAASARLTSVTARTEGRALVVAIEVSEPAPYVMAQPDPLTVVIDLRNVTVSGMTEAVGPAAGPVADIAVEAARAEDGAPLARVRLSLAQPVKPTVRSRRASIFVEFADPAGLGASSPSAPNGRVMTPAPTPAAQAAAPKPVLVNETPAGGRAEPLTLKKIDITAAPFGTRVTVSANGALPADVSGLLSVFEPTPNDPPRLILDFRAMTTVAQTVPGPPDGPVARVRVAQNSRQPLVARVVIDLRQLTPYRIENVGGQATVVFEPAAGGGPPAAALAANASKASSAPPAVAPATPEPTPVVVLAKPAVEPVKATAALEPALAKPDPAPATKPAAPPPAAPVVPAPEPTMAPTEPARTPSQAQPAARPAQEPAAGGSQRPYTGNPVTFDFVGADLRAVLRAFSDKEISGLNVVIDPSIQGTVDVSLREVPWDQALEVILRAHKLGYVIENNVVRISTLKALAEEEQDRQRLAETQAKGGQLKVLTRSLSYAKASDLAKLLKDARVLTDRGTAFVDERSNTLIINDLAAALVESEALIAVLDRAEPQVEVEARIVQTSRENARALGVQWGATGRMAPELANTSPLRFPAQGSVSGRTGGTQGNPLGPARSETPTGINLPVTGATSAVGLSLGTLNGAFNLDMALSALEKKGNGRILSSPRVVMQNNVEAEMYQGIQIPIQTVSNNTVTVTFKDAALSLRVRPQITASNTVIMTINLENASPDYSREVNGIPPIDTQRAVTQVLVNDGDTTVIGGIQVQRETNANDRVPGLARIPLLGWLFRRDSVSDDNRELLIFITPKIRR